MPNSRPLPLRYLVTPNPEAFREGDLHLLLIASALRLVGRTAHTKPSRGAPSKFDAEHRPLLAGLMSGETFSGNIAGLLLAGKCCERGHRDRSYNESESAISSCVRRFPNAEVHGLRMLEA